jgi:hypothetical protein
MMSKLSKLTLIISLVFSFSSFAEEKTEPVPALTLIKNVQIFNGKSDKLIKGKDVLIENNLIKNIGTKLSTKNTTPSYRRMPASTFQIT